MIAKNLAIMAVRYDELHEIYEALQTPNYAGQFKKLADVCRELDKATTNPEYSSYDEFLLFAQLIHLMARDNGPRERYLSWLVFKMAPNEIPF